MQRPWRGAADAEAWRGAADAEAWRGAAHWLAPYGLLGLLSYKTRNHPPRVASPTMGLPLSPSMAI